jgi:hypothetical protein
MSKGYLGYGHHLSPGDCVCLFPGCPLPVVLRKVKLHYLRVSTAFVLGFMDGDILQSLDDGRMNLSYGQRGRACEGAGRQKDRIRAAETGKKQREGPQSRAGRCWVGREGGRVKSSAR